jgi:hypothetical protein
MRCISPHGAYSIQVIEGETQVGVDATGRMHSVELRKPQVANFEKGGLTEWEQEAALLNFGFSGLPEGVNPLTRVSVFDTEAFVQKVADPVAQKELLEVLDSRLRHLQKQHPSEFMIVEKPAAEIPWPTYDTDTIQDILGIQARLGFSPEKIRVYEHENQGRKPVIDAMTAIEEGVEGEIEVVSIDEALTVDA